ncbi:MAG: AbrB/MazE/SpoVT family DNA-binding domain-containing protein [Candidatus Nitrosopolaris sp.]
MSSSEKTEMRKIQALQGERSFVLVLPKDFATELNIGKGDYVKCNIVSNSLVIKKAEI